MPMCEKHALSIRMVLRIREIGDEELADRFDQYIGIETRMRMSKWEPPPSPSKEQARTVQEIAEWFTGRAIRARQMVPITDGVCNLPTDAYQRKFELLDEAQKYELYAATLTDLLSHASQSRSEIKTLAEPYTFLGHQVLIHQWQREAYNKAQELAKEILKDKS